MCGIAGEVTRGDPPADLTAASRHLRHRGPDDHGAWSGERCALVHRRLAVIDTSQGGHQPMATPDGELVVTFNGEIFNHVELRAELVRRGVAFRSHSDTEVLLEAFRAWGVGCLDRLNGMFAFAVWDQRSRQLFVARDRLGEKPLFHTSNARRFRFASEIGALFAPDGSVPRTPDLVGIDAYCTWGYVPSPRTAYEAVQVLPPGHWLRVDASRGHLRVEERRWWNVAYEPKSDLAEHEAAAELRQVLTDAVRLRARSDVPVGALLSGGVDSSAVVALLGAASSAPVRTFTIGFSDPEVDERGHARRVAERFGTEHVEDVVGAPEEEVVIDLVRHHGQPFGDSSSVPTWYAARLAREHVSVVLTGDGGDESFAGYPRHRANRLAERAPVPDGLTPARRHLRWTGLFDQRLRDGLYGPDLRNASAPDGAAATAEALTADVSDPLDQALAIDLRSYLPDDLLAKVDIATMAHGLEARAPFLDHRVVELAARLPSVQKLRGSRSKHLLLAAMEDQIPMANVERPKMGFSGPVAAWLRGPLHRLAREAIAGLPPEWFATERTEALLAEHHAGRVDHTGRIWALMALGIWWRERG